MNRATPIAAASDRPAAGRTGVDFLEIIDHGAQNIWNAPFEKWQN